MPFPFQGDYSLTPASQMLGLLEQFIFHVPQGVHGSAEQGV